MFSNADWKIKKITAPISWLPLAPQQPQLCDLLSKLYYHLSKWQNRKTVQGCRYRVRFIWKLHLSTWDPEYICPSIIVQVSTGKKKKKHNKDGVCCLIVVSSTSLQHTHVKKSDSHTVKRQRLDLYMMKKTVACCNMTWKTLVVYNDYSLSRNKGVHKSLALLVPWLLNFLEEFKDGQILTFCF